MSKKDKESKKYKYLITMRWYVETDEKLVAGAAETDKKLLNLVQPVSYTHQTLPTTPYV